MRKDLIHGLIIAIFIMGTHAIAKPFFADYHYRKASYIEGTQWPEAIVAFHKAINLDPSNAAYHAKLGHLYLSRSRHLPAIKINSQQSTVNGQPSTLQLAASSFQKAIELCPNNGNYWLGLGMVYEQEVKLKAHSSPVEYASPHLNMPCIQQDKHSTGQAKVKAPSTTHDSPFIIHRSRTTDNSQLTTLQLAAASYQKAISLDPNNAFFHTMLGSFHIRNGNKEEGLKEYEKAITSLPRLKLYDFLNNKDVKDEFLDAAIKGLRKAIKLYPRDPDIYHQLGSIYIKKGLYNEAIEQYECAVKLKPEHKGFKRTLYSLKNQNSSH